MTENEILERKIKVLEELVEIQRQIIDALKALPIYPPLPQPMQSPFQWVNPMIPDPIRWEGITGAGFTDGISGNIIIQG